MMWSVCPTSPPLCLKKKMPMSTIYKYVSLTIDPSQSLCDDLVDTKVRILFHPLDVLGGDVQFLQLFHHLSPTACCKRQRLQQITWLIVFAVLRPFEDILHSIINIHLTNKMPNFFEFFFPFEIRSNQWF